MQKHRWTEQEIETLRNSYADLPNEDIALMLELPKESVKGKAMRLGLRKSEAYTERLRRSNAERNLPKMRTDAALEKQRHGIREMIRKERLRMKYGLRRKTKRNISLFIAARPEKYLMRQTAKRRGYLISDKERAVRYNGQTKRHERTEQYFKAHGYTVERQTQGSNNP